MTAISNTSPRPVVPAIGAIETSLSPFAESLIRAAAGLLLLPHGAQKLFGWFGGYGIEATGQFFATKLGLPTSLALVAGLIEFFGGILLTVGFLTRAVAALIMGLMFVAVEIASLHHPQPVAIL